MSNKRAGLPLGSLVSTGNAEASAPRSAWWPPAEGLSCIRVVRAHSLASVALLAKTGNDVSVSLPEFGVS
eukprot:14998245-Alexandrium_andersonii.AAC.1